MISNFNEMSCNYGFEPPDEKSAAGTKRLKINQNANLPEKESNMLFEDIGFQLCPGAIIREWSGRRTDVGTCARMH